MTAAPNAPLKDSRLDSWKAIAAFFGKDERTVKRWEKERGLPVRRVPGAARGTVFAYAGELERWLEGRGEDSSGVVVKGLELAEGPATVQYPARVHLRTDQPEPSTDALHLERRAPDEPVVSSWVRILTWALPIFAVLSFVVYASLGRHELRFNKALAAPHGPDATAQDLYLKGRFYFEKRTPQDLNTAVDAFTQAIVHDPGYAQAYVGLADTYSLLREYSTLSTLEAEQRARAAAQKAVELDPNLAEAHTSLAFAEFWGFLDAADADREFRRAIELDPSLARAHHWYATFLTQVLRTDQALAEIERARQLDPSSKSILADKGSILADAGRYEEARTLLKQIEVSDPSFRSSHAYLAIIYWDQGDYPASLEEFHKEAWLRGNETLVKDAEAQQQALREGGAEGLFQSRLNAALRAFEHENGSAFDVASAYGYLHQRDEAMKYLETARQRHDPSLAHIERAGEFRWLHTDLEFRKLVTGLGLPPLS